MTTNSSRLMAGVALGLAVGLAIFFSVQELARTRSEKASLEREFKTLRAETEEAASRLGLVQMSRPQSQPSSEVLRLRGEVARLSRELADLGAISPSNSVSEVNRSRRDQLALEAVELFQNGQRARATQLSSVFQALNQIASQQPDFEFHQADGQLHAGLAQLFPALPWTEVQVLCHDSKSLRFLQTFHPDEVVVSFVQPILDPSGESVQAAICANGQVISESTASFHRHSQSTSAKLAGEDTLSAEWKQFRETSPGP